MVYGTMDIVVPDSLTSESSELNLESSNIYGISDSYDDRVDVSFSEELTNAADKDDVTNSSSEAAVVGTSSHNKSNDKSTDPSAECPSSQSNGTVITDSEVFISPPPLPSNGMIMIQTLDGPVLHCGSIQLNQQDLEHIQQQLHQRLLSQPTATTTPLQMDGVSPQQYVILGPINQQLSSMQANQISMQSSPIPSLQNMAPLVTVSQTNSVAPPLVKAPTLRPTSKLTKAPVKKNAPFVESTTDKGDEFVDLEELEKFAKHFKQRRIELGFTQGDVGTAVGRSFHNDFSQTTISRFEALNLSFKNMCKLKSLLEQWLHTQENKQVKAVSDSLAGRVTPEISCKRRKKRTTIEDNVRDILEEYFSTNTKPNTEQLTKIAEDHNLERDVVRVWFCNRRQKQKKLHNCNLQPVYSSIQVTPHSDTHTFITSLDDVSTYKYIVEESDTVATIHTKALVNTTKSPLTTSVQNKSLEQLSAAMASPKGAALKGFTTPLVFHNSL